MIKRICAARCLPYLLACITLSALYSIGLGRSPLLDPDEPIYGQFVKEMVANGNWLTPHYAGQIWFDKPPLFYWLSSACVKVLGLSEFSIRLPSAMFAALTVVLVYLLARRDFGSKAGFLASGVVGTTLLQIVLSHAAATDAIMVFFMVAGLLCYRYWLDEKGKRAIFWMAACGAAAGFGMLAKGPVVPLLLLVTFICHLIWTKNLGRLWSVDTIIGIGLAVIVGLPWYVAMLVMHGKLFVDQFIMANNLERFLKPLHASHSPHWYSRSRTLLLLLLFFYPWSVFLPQALRQNLRGNVGAKLAICWIAVVLLFFSASSTQNFTYSFPAFPACAVLVGAYLSGIGEDRSRIKGMTAGLIVGLVVSVLMAVALYIIAKSKYPQVMPVATLTSVVLGLVYGVPAMVLLLRRQIHHRVPWMIAGGMFALNLVVVGLLIPQVASYKSSDKIARHMNNGPSADVASYRLWRPGLLYYLDRAPYDVKTVSEIEQMARHSEPKLIVCSETDEKVVERFNFVEVYGIGDLDVYANAAYMRSSGVR